MLGSGHNKMALFLLLLETMFIRTVKICMSLYSVSQTHLINTSARLALSNLLPAYRQIDRVTTGEDRNLGNSFGDLVSGKGCFAINSKFPIDFLIRR